MVPPINHQSLMPSGRYRGIRMSNVPARYLVWLYKNADKLRPDLKAYIETNMDVFKQQIKFNNMALRR